MAYSVDKEGTRWAERPAGLVPRGLLAANYRRSDFINPARIYLPPDAPTPPRWVWYRDRHAIVALAAGMAVILALTALLVLS
jgi:hypothetical protein